MKEFESYKSFKTFKNFYELNQIPRCSNDEVKVSNFLVEFGKQLGLETVQDEVLNVMIKKPGTFGLEDAKPVALQAHIDMVCEKESTCNHDFTKDPIDMYIDEDFLKAKGTTLGADNGLGVAMAMDILESTDVKHPPLEVIFTATEETGMDGAIGLSESWLKAERLINLDTEDEGIMIIGCAGGINAFLEIPAKYQEVKGLINKKVSVAGLKGGHSGLTIGSEHLNALKVLDEMIQKLKSNFEIKIQNINGGTKHNAIPSSAYAYIGIKKEELADFEEKFEALTDEKVNSYIKRESSLSINLELAPNYEIYLCDETAKKALTALSLLPHGVNTMSDIETEMVESSNNLAIAQIINDTFKISLSVRSSNEEQRQVVINKIEDVARRVGANISYSDGYPMWEPNYDSALAEIAKDSYKSLRNEELVVKSIHAGLETGLLSKKYPQMDMISIGPNIFGAHTPNERLSISSTEFTREFLIDILTRL